MKILHVIGTVDPRTGGTVEAVRLSANVMVECGIEVEIATLDSPIALPHVQDTFAYPIHFVGADKGSYYGYSTRFKEWIHAHATDYDAVIIHGLWQYHSLVASRACRKYAIPYFIFTHGMLDPWFNTTYPLKRLKKLLYWFWGENPGLRHATAVLFTTDEERLLARKSFPCYKVNEQVVGLGTHAPCINLEQASADFRAHLKPWAQRPYFLFMSRIQEKKGLDLLVAAYASLRSHDSSIPELVIAGPIQQQDYADQIKTNYDQSGIHWIGTLSGIEKWQALVAAEAMTLISHQENFGIVIAEALAVGTPVLISNKINIWREIEQGGAGLVTNDNIEGARKILENWLQQSDEERQRMITATTATFQKYFEIQRSTQRLITYIESTL
jgi:glycosyltransferase involved in cell wall biosynthesis